MWLTKEAKTALSTLEKIECIDQFHEINPLGDVVLTGGEPFLKYREVISIAERCRKHGMKSVLNSNGYRLSKFNTDELLESGPDILVFSIDASNAFDHDKIRGVEGSFSAVEKILTNLANSRSRGSSPRMLVSSVLHEGNIREAHKIVEMAREMGADGITFQALEKTFFHQGKADKFFTLNWFKHPECAKQELRFLWEKYENDDFFLLTLEDIIAIEAYIDHPNVLPYPVCGAATQNLVIDANGEIRLCSYMDTLTNGKTLGNVRSVSLEQALTSGFAIEIRSTMLACRKSCGVLNCNRISAN
jgi:MoaA/NifB/PqqE/SkfB family radical SAM enzyme